MDYDIKAAVKEDHANSNISLKLVWVITGTGRYRTRPCSCSPCARKKGHRNSLSLIYLSISYLVNLKDKGPEMLGLDSGVNVLVNNAGHILAGHWRRTHLRSVQVSSLHLGVALTSFFGAPNVARVFLPHVPDELVQLCAWALQRGVCKACWMLFAERVLQRKEFPRLLSSDCFGAVQMQLEDHLKLQFEWDTVSESTDCS
ncbi:uncharacterized protein BT62DRAFT_933123 [Guyanagaster necrorhizus]|uniref:Uncharacterized protein n=1 Tax=Guyanagaster necrorhizus TaxID=856835 RepID=A0A9P7VQY8_9AGAR|nr:uncharacterized protein BT62DRAFT_933123 [Guyanagaster necrorhizus MCA 3950]KAG7445284.1 hypothetical protein BT62DRAFT_933123 [Guyanagaster necrorhizus MCA 3950]